MKPRPADKAINPEVAPPAEQWPYLHEVTTAWPWWADCVVGVGGVAALIAALAFWNAIFG